MRIRRKGNCASSTGTPESGQWRHPAAIPALDSPALSAHLPPPRGSAAKRPEWESSFGNKCEPPRDPVAEPSQFRLQFGNECERSRAQYDQFTWA